MTRDGQARFELLGAHTGNCLRVAVTLEVLGLSYDPVAIDLRGGEQHRPEFLATSRFAKVPVLLDRTAGGAPRALTQSNAILLHLCSLQPGRLLPLEGDPERTRVLERFFYFVTDVIAVGASYFQMSRAGQPECAELLLDRAIDAIVDAEPFLVPGPYMAGSDFSLTDIAAVTVIHAYSHRIAWARLPRLRTWFDRVTSRDDVQRGLTAFPAG